MIITRFENNKTFIDLKVRPAGLFLKIFVFTIALTPILMILSIAMFSKNIESPFGFFLGILFFGALSLFLFRYLLWNSYGKECYTITPAEFTAANDFKWFRDNPKSVTHYSSLEIKYSEVEKPDILFELTEESLQKAKKKIDYNIIFLVDDVVYRSVVKVQAGDLFQLVIDLQNRPAKN